MSENYGSCPACGGHGVVMHAPAIPCEPCKGRGKTYDSTGLYPSGCLFCRGTGKVIDECGRCDGTGRCGNAMSYLNDEYSKFEVRESWEWSYGKDYR